MKLIAKVLVVIVAIFVLYWLLAAAVGMAMYIVIIAVVVGLIALILKLLFSDRKDKSPEAISHKKAEKVAERKLKEMEKLNRQ